MEASAWDWRALRRHVLREAKRLTQDDHAAEDIVQLALVRAWRHRSSCAEPGAPLGWLLAITRNEARRWHTRPASREVPADVAEDRRLCGSSSVEESALNRLSVQDVVRRLSSDERRLYVLRYGEDLTQAEIARRLSWPEGTVKVRLHRLRRRLAMELEAADS